MPAGDYHLCLEVTLGAHILFLSLSFHFRALEVIADLTFELLLQDPIFGGQLVSRICWIICAIFSTNYRFFFSQGAVSQHVTVLLGIYNCAMT